MVAETFNMADGSQQLDFFKRFYGPISENLFNSMNVLHGRIRRDFNNFVGSEYRPANRLSFQGGFGAGKLPIAGGKRAKQASVTTKKLYQRVSLDRESIKASMGNKGAFVRATKESIRGAVESYTRNCSRILFGDGSGILGRSDGTAIPARAGNAGPYIVRIAKGGVAPAPDANFEEEDLVQVVRGLNPANNQGGTMHNTLYKVQRVNATPTAYLELHLVESGTNPGADGGSNGGALATGALATTVGFCMQGSYDKEPEGFRSTIEHANAGSLYGIDIQRRWSARQRAVGGALNFNLIREEVLNIHKRFGRVGKIIVTSYEQYNNLLELLDSRNQKRYEIKARTMKSKTLQAKTSFTGISLMTEAGEVGIFFERFCPADRLYIINDDYIKVPTRPGHGWFNDDGRILLRESDSDSYEGRYGGYWNNYIVPTAHGVLTGLTV